MPRLIILFCFILFSSNFNGQNTVGIISNTANAYAGYTLFTSEKNTYLINNCGEVLHKWTSTTNSSKTVYLLENGNLLRNSISSSTSTIQIAGKTGRLELFNWDNALLWSFEYSDDSHVNHHDIFPLPNGNILMVAASVLTETEAINLGRDPSLLPEHELYNEQIIEIQPTGSNTANIVWEWNTKDHIIQDFDNTKSNFGNVSQNPQRLNINYLGSSTATSNWMHVNSAQYNAVLNQIIISTRKLSEFYIIDHSTTTAEAATSTGGTYQKGGDILYRWGNPVAYNQGTSANQQLYGQHYPHWIAPGLPDAGKIMVFNNGFGRTPAYSQIFKITPPASTPGVYTYTSNTSYGPSNPDYIYEAPVSTDFYSVNLSSGQQLQNGNILITVGALGTIFEIDSNKDIVWKYINPLSSSGVIMTQGDDPSIVTNVLFRSHKYAPTYAAFTGRNLAPGNPIESNPNTGACQILKTENQTLLNLSLSPNPVKDILKISTSKTLIKTEIYSVLGKLVFKSTHEKNINLQNLKAGMYFIKIFSDETIITKKIIKI